MQKRYLYQIKFSEKLQRAYDGCLGTYRRRRTRLPAKSPGQTVTVSDPGVSESGNRTRVMSCYTLLNQISRSKLTEGTETSKYLLEEKTNVISLVAASETETA